MQMRIKERKLDPAHKIIIFDHSTHAASDLPGRIQKFLLALVLGVTGELHTLNLRHRR